MPVSSRRRRAVRLATSASFLLGCGSRTEPTSKPTLRSAYFSGIGLVVTKQALKNGSSRRCSAADSPTRPARKCPIIS